MTVVIINELLEYARPQSLHDRSKHLTMECFRINYAADILHRNVVEHLEMPGLRIDAYMCGMRAVTVRPAVIVKCPLGLETIGGEFRHSAHFAGGDNRAHLIDDFNFVGSASELFRCRTANRELEIGSGIHQR